MSVGGSIIEIKPMKLLETGQDVIRLWVVDRNGEETCVYAYPANHMPNLGDAIWWQAGKIYFDGDRKRLVKVGYSFRPQADDQHPARRA